jgi:hypothetical protein
MAGVPEPGEDPTWPNREATKINLALGKVGYSDSQVTSWWNQTSHVELGGLTPTQAWNSGDIPQVKALVEKLISTQFATELADNPTILKRLQKAKHA